MIKIKNIAILVFVIVHAVHAQFLSNPSFESDIIGEWNPEGWTACYESTTLDVQPGIWGIDLAPSHGNTYLGMTARGANKQSAKNEAAQTELLKPLTAGGCYMFEIDMAQGISVDGLYDYTDPLKFVIWGGKDYCSKGERLAESEIIDHQEWKRYKHIFMPQDNYNYLMLEMIVRNDQIGYLLFDNMSLTEVMNKNLYIKMDTTIRPDDYLELNSTAGTSVSWSPEIGLTCHDCRVPVVETGHSEVFIATIMSTEGCLFHEIYNVNINLFIPNVFTPNGDGVNEFFRIDGLYPNSRLHIYNRLGQLVYTDNNYKNTWNGLGLNQNPLPEDTYWYVLNIPGDQDSYKGNVYLKR